MGWCFYTIYVKIGFIKKLVEYNHTRDPKVKNEKASVPKNDYETQKKLKSLQNKQSKVEREIADLEQELKKIDQELEHNYDQMIAQPNFFEGYHGKKDKLAVLLKKWEVVAEELMELE